jgi:hypothetical protein
VTVAPFWTPASLASQAATAAEPGPDKVALALESVQPARVEDRVGARVR